MTERAKATTIWEDNPDTPIDSSGLSSSFDYQSVSKFLHYSDTDDDYLDWADYVINLSPWPDGTEDDVGKIVYNKFDQLAKTAFVGQGAVIQWSPLSSPYKKIIRILSGTRVTSSYVNISAKTIYESFHFSSDQIFSVDDLLVDEDFIPDSFYSIYLLHKYEYGDEAAIKIVNSIYDDVVEESGWSKQGTSSISPSGYNVISYRKIGGFKTDSSKHIEEQTIWDLSTYRSELAIERIKVVNNGIVEDLYAKDIPIVSSVGEVLFAADDVQDALIETRIVLDNLKDSFYTNRRGGFILRFAQVKPSSPGGPLIETADNEISLVITAGFIDVAKNEVVFEDNVFLSDSSLQMNINDGEFASNRLLGDVILSGGHHTRLYPGIWRVFIDKFSRILLKEQGYLGGMPVWDSSVSGWYDSINGSRCIGKFSVSNNGSSIFWIDKLSVTGTLDFDPPIGTLFHFHGTMCPDGLIPCDGFWHDITGNDQDDYTISTLPDIEDWGNSWYEEAPDLMGKTLKISSTPTMTNTGGKFEISKDPDVIKGGSDDLGSVGGSDNHRHELEHSHTVEELSTIASGEHTHNDIVSAAPPSESRIDVVEVGSGVEVSVGDHIHVISQPQDGSGEHNHAAGEISGNTSELTGESALSDLISSWPSYKEVLVCIKK